MKLLKRASIAFAVGVAAIACVFGIWSYLFPAPSDRCPQYLLWKLGLIQINRRVIFSSMARDSHREQLVLGQTIAELEGRFGRLRTRDEGTSIQKSRIAGWLLDKDIRWLDDTPWLVIFVNRRATELHLLKG